MWRFLRVPDLEQQDLLEKQAITEKKKFEVPKQTGKKPRPTLEDLRKASPKQTGLDFEESEKLDFGSTKTMPSGKVGKVKPPEKPVPKKKITERRRWGREELKEADLTKLKPKELIKRKDYLLRLTKEYKEDLTHIDEFMEEAPEVGAPPVGKRRVFVKGDLTGKIRALEAEIGEISKLTEEPAAAPVKPKSLKEIKDKIRTVRDKYYDLEEKINDEREGEPTPKEQDRLDSYKITLEKLADDHAEMKMDEAHKETIAKLTPAAPKKQTTKAPTKKRMAPNWISEEADAAAEENWAGKITQDWEDGKIDTDAAAEILRSNDLPLDNVPKELAAAVKKPTGKSEQISLVKIEARAPTGNVFDLEELPVEKAREAMEYAEKIGLKGKLRVGKVYKGR